MKLFTLSSDVIFISNLYGCQIIPLNDGNVVVKIFVIARLVGSYGLVNGFVKQTTIETDA